MSASAVARRSTPHERVTQRPANVVIAVAGDPTGVGGAMTLAAAVRAVISSRGDSARIIGWSSDENGHPDVAPLPFNRLTWRIAIRSRVRRLAAWLRTQPRPGHVIAVSPFWGLAVRRAWPTTTVSLAFPCLLSNCLPFTWKTGRPSNRWERFEYEHIRRIERDALVAADRIVVQTPATADEVLAFAPEAQSRLRICPTGAPAWARGDSDNAYPGASTIADTDSPRRTERHNLAVADADTLFLWVGHFDRNKDPILAVRALALAATPSAKLILCGSGPLNDDVHTLVCDLKLERQVRLLGDVATAEMPRLYAAADVLIVTSGYDAFPNVVVEAMSAARPVIVPYHAPPICYSGAATLVDDRTGWRYDRRDANALASLIRTVAGDRNAALARGEAARRIALETCCWRRYTDALFADD